ncbi:hypothetical protein LCGC14_2982650, partial [marine sediment metagenome]
MAEEFQKKAQDEVAGLIRETVDPSSWSRIRGASVNSTNGRLVVTQTEANQKAIANLLDQLREARGAQVEVGGNIARQRAEGILSEDQDADLSGKAEFQRFVARNY